MAFSRLGLARLGLAFAFFPALSGCDVYSETLLGATGGGGTTNGPTTTSASGGGGVGGGLSGCEVPADCPGMDSECGTRTCGGGTCGVDAVSAGTQTAQQSPNDCARNVCDGSGDVTTEPDDTDTATDGSDCTLDTCSAGVPVHTPKNEGTACTGAGPSKVCTATGDCVECLDGTDCTSGVCNSATNSCANAACGDNLQNGTESDTDCGGSCPPCPLGDTCGVAADCESGVCSTTCQPSCTDGVENQTETGIDCGGPCSPCDVGGGCVDDGDCVSAVCTGVICGEYQLLISELRPRGPGGATDDFIEIYNPRGAAVTLTTEIEVLARSDASAVYTSRFKGSGQVLGARRHLLIAGSGYSGAAPPDKLDTGGVVADKSSVIVQRGTTLLDAVCEYCGATSPFTTHSCEGTPINFSGCSSNNTDRSLERKPGGAAGNATDTGDSTADFAISTPANPQNLASAATP